MPYNALVYKVLISCPGDVKEGRDIAREVIEDWNVANAESTGKTLRPVDWKKDAVPATGGRPQELLNEQIVDDCDLLVAIFWTRAGTSTGKAISGTVEEIDRHIEAGKPAMVYFLDTPIGPSSMDRKQLEQLDKVKEKYKEKGIVWEVDNPLKFGQEFARHLATTMNKDAYFQRAAREADAGLSADTSVESPGLSKEATQLLLQATSADDGGNIMRSMSMRGLEVKVGKRVFFKGGDKRDMATWRGAIDELCESGLIEDAGSKGDVFRVTTPGFELADKIRAATEADKGPSPKLLKATVQAFAQQQGKASSYLACEVNVFLEFPASTELAIPYHKCDLSFKLGSTCFELEELQVFPEGGKSDKKAAHTVYLPRPGLVIMKASAEGVQFPSDHDTADAVMSFQLGLAGCQEPITQDVILTRVEPVPPEWARWELLQD